MSVLHDIEHLVRLYVELCGYLRVTYRPRAVPLYESLRANDEYASFRDFFDPEDHWTRDDGGKCAAFESIEAGIRAYP